MFHRNLQNRVTILSTPTPMTACSATVTLTPGVPYHGDTSSALNTFQEKDYPDPVWIDQGWGEYGPDVVHQVTVAGGCDLRIHVEPDPVLNPDLDVFLLDTGTCDTGNMILAGEDTIIYPGCPAGTYYIIVDGKYADSMGSYTLTAACSTGLLLVDDDGSSDTTQCFPSLPCDDVGPLYETALTNAGISYTTWDTTLYGPPDSATLNNSADVVWVTGESYGDSPTNTNERIRNAGFENGYDAASVWLWQQSLGTSDVIYSNATYAHTGSWYAYFGGLTNYSDNLYQDVYIPADATTANLTFWLWIATTETSPWQYDSLTLKIQDTQGNDLETLATYYDEDYTSGYVSHPTAGESFSLLGYAGQTIRIYFESDNDGSYNTRFRVDDISLKTYGRVPEVLSVEEQSRIRTFLDLGGHMLLTGQDILWDVTQAESVGEHLRLPDGSLMNDYFQVSEVYNDVWTSSPSPLRIWGIPGSPISDEFGCDAAVYYFDIDNTPFTYKADALITRYGDPVYYTAQAPSDPDATRKAVGLRYESPLIMIDSIGLVGLDDYKALFLAFNPESDATASRLQTLVANTKAWFDRSDETLCDIPYDSSAVFDDSVSGDGNGIPDPGETFDVILTVYNDDTVAQTFYVYYGLRDPYLTVNSDRWVCLGSIAASGSADATFSMTLSGSAPTGYRLSFEFNLAVGSTAEFCWLDAYGSFAGFADFMLVKDEGEAPNTTGVDVYTSLLDSLGFTYALWDTSMFAAPTYASYGLPNDWMAFYPMIIWFTGKDDIYTLTPNPWDAYLGINPEAEIATYLDSSIIDFNDPGRLILSTQDYFMDRYGPGNISVPSGDFAFTHLGVERVYQDFLKDASGTLYGFGGTYSSEELTMGITNYGPDGITFPNYADRLEMLNSNPYFQRLWAYALEPIQILAGTSLTHYSQPYRVAFMPFAFENVQDAFTPSTKLRFLDRLIGQMFWSDPNPVDNSAPPWGHAPITGTQPTLYVNKLGEDFLMNWTDAGASPTNCNGETAYTHYKVVGQLNNPDFTVFQVPALYETPLLEAPADHKVDPGEIFYYRVFAVDSAESPIIETGCP